MPKILIADDDPDIIESIKDLLAKKFDLDSVNNGEEVLTYLDKVNYNIDLLILDIMMPRLDGYETCKKLKQNDIAKNIPVIFLTARTRPDDIVKGFEVGGVDYIVKPFHSAELLMRVKTHLDLKLSKEIIQKQSNDRKELIHVMCHDLANPINCMMSILELAKNNISILEEMQDDMISTVANAADIIDLVRKMQALEEGKYHLYLEDVNLKLILNESISLFKQKLSKKNLDLIIQIEDHLYVNVERISFLNSVINNIITNAIKFSFPDSKIMINSHINENRVTISIRDFGIGIPKKLLHDIFNVNKPTSREGTVGETGTGFGMPLVKKFMLIYGGDIQILSNEKLEGSINHGTEAILILNGSVK